MNVNKNDLLQLVELISEVAKLRGMYDELTEACARLTATAETLTRENERLLIKNKALIEENKKLKYNIPSSVM